MTDLTDRQLLRVLEDEGGALLDLAAGTDMTRPVVACPGWTVADLVAHLTSVYRWARLIVGERRNERPSPQERAALDDDGRAAPALLEALAEAHARLLAVLRATPPGTNCWTMWPATDGRAYWIRRQAHETLIHRVDVQLAAAGLPDGPPELETAAAGLPDGPPELETAVAADGVDEMVTGFAQRFSKRLRLPHPHTVSLHATDAERSWWMLLGPQEPEFGRGTPDSPAGTEVRARSAELLLLLWNRRNSDGLDVTGTDAPLLAWRHGTS
jgi:uncharacterized protein (TIGR03083 family)